VSFFPIIEELSESTEATDLGGRQFARVGKLSELSQLTFPQGTSGNVDWLISIEMFRLF
jgi:hypothetical protein